MGAIRAAVALGSGNVYIFQDQSYRRYEFLTGAAPDAPQDIAAQWSGLSPDAPDAAVHWGGGKVFFFYGATYLRYDLGNDAVDPEYLPPSARRTIAQYWPGLWTDGIDAAVNWGNGKIFFFKAGEYVRYDMTSDRVDDGYPRPIEGNWPGVWTDGIDAVFYQGGGQGILFPGGDLPPI